MKKTILILSLFVFGLSSFAQEYSWRLTYDVSIPLGEFSEDYISNASWRGIGIDNRWEMADRLTVGGYIGWHTFYEKKDNILASNADGSLSAFGNQFRYLNTWTFQINSHYYLSEPGNINPWIGLGVGTAYSVQRTELGFLAYIYKPWSFSLSPQIGVDIPLGISTDFTISVRYNYLMNGEDKATSDFTYLGINTGFKFSMF